MIWNQGRTAVEQLISAGEIERVHPDRSAADSLLEQARRHLDSAGAVADSDPAGAYSLLYDAARKALAAVLENEGLRATSKGGHLAVYEAVRAQLDPPLGRVLAPFDRMRRRRNTVEYGASSQRVCDDEVREDAEKALAIVEATERLLDEMAAF